MNTQNLSEATKELDAAMRGGRVRHDGNGVLAWCVGNVVGHYDARCNVFPRRAREDQKIDAAAALIMALARCMANRVEVSVYETRGLLVIGWDDNAQGGRSAGQNRGAPGGDLRCRMRAIWDCLALPIAEFTLTPVPACGALPAIYDPHHLLNGQHVDGWVTAHWAYDYYPGIGGSQHRVRFMAGWFVAHGVPASLLPPPSAKVF
jgi:hypothetical protein